MGKSSPATSTQNTTTTQNVNPWATAAPYFPDLYQTGHEALGASQAAPLPTEFVAQENPTEAAAVSGTLAAAPTLGASGTALSDQATKLASGYYLDPTNDPTLQAAIGSAITPAYTTLTEQLLPSVTNAGIRGGGVGGGPSAYGGANAGAASDIERERVLRDWGVTAGNIGATMTNAERNAAFNLIPQAGGVAQAANQQILAPSTTTGLAGTQIQQYGQNAIDNLLQAYQYATQGPWAGIQNFVNLLTAGGYTSGTGTSQSTGTYTAPQPSLATQLLQGALGGLGVAGSLFGVPTSGVSAAGNIWNMLSGAGGK
jgi:hypothetical protein